MINVVFSQIKKSADQAFILGSTFFRKRPVANAIATLHHAVGGRSASAFVYSTVLIAVAAAMYIAHATVAGANTPSNDRLAMGRESLPVSGTPGSDQSSQQLLYRCPMHPTMQSRVHNDKCSICGMNMSAVERLLSTTDTPSHERHELSSASDILAMEPVGMEHTSMEHARPSVLMAYAMVNKLGVRSEAVQIGPMHRRVSTPGFIQRLSDEGRSRYIISADGQVESLFVRAGDWVEPGQALFSWSSPALIKAQQFHLRMVEKLGVASASTASSSERLLAFGLSKEAIKLLEQSGHVLESVTVNARREGRVLQMSLREGASFKKGQLLFHVGGMVRATVLANAFQRDAAWIRPGQKAEVRLQGRGKAYPGVVSQGAVSINPNSQNIGVKLSFSAPIDEVRQAMYVSGVIFDQLHDEVLTVPLESVIWLPEGNRVIRDLGHGLFEPVVVSLGEEADGRVVVNEGLNAKDRVVSSAQFLIDSESNLRMALNRLNAYSHH